MAMATADGDVVVEMEEKAQLQLPRRIAWPGPTGGVPSPSGHHPSPPGGAEGAATRAGRLTNGGRCRQHCHTAAVHVRAGGIAVGRPPRRKLMGGCVIVRQKEAAHTRVFCVVSRRQVFAREPVTRQASKTMSGLSRLETLEVGRSSALRALILARSPTSSYSCAPGLPPAKPTDLPVRLSRQFIDRQNTSFDPHAHHPAEPDCPGRALPPREREAY